MPDQTYVIFAYRMRSAIGPFDTREVAESYLAALPDPRGWHVVPVDYPQLATCLLPIEPDDAPADMSTYSVLPLDSCIPPGHACRVCGLPLEAPVHSTLGMMVDGAFVARPDDAHGYIETR